MPLSNRPTSDQRREFTGECLPTFLAARRSGDGNADCVRTVARTHGVGHRMAALSAAASIGSFCEVLIFSSLARPARSSMTYCAGVTLE